LIFQHHRQFIQEYPMATSAAAAVQDEPRQNRQRQLKAIIERIERSEKRRRRSPTTSATSMGKPRATASTSRCCAPSCGCAKQDANERAEQETILETYMQALGML